jgi:hypothetical protein
MISPPALFTLLGQKCGCPINDWIACQARTGCFSEIPEYRLTRKPHKNTIPAKIHEILKPYFPYSKKGVRVYELFA